MQAALIVMTILGCNDASTDCHFVATPEPRWTTISLCEAASGEQLETYANRSNYPVLIATCQAPQPEKPIVSAQTPVPDSATTPVQAPAVQPDKIQEGVIQRALEHTRAMLPTTEGVRGVVTAPARFVSDGYSWVVSTFRK